jgi:hypothetical protein
VRSEVTDKVHEALEQGIINSDFSNLRSWL